MPAGRVFKPPGPASIEINTAISFAFCVAPLAPPPPAAGAFYPSLRRSALSARPLRRARRTKTATYGLKKARLRTQKQDTRQGGEAERRPRRRHSLTSASLDADVDLADKAAGGSIECGSLEGEFMMTQRAADHGRSDPSGAPVNILRRPLERRAHGRARSQEAEAPQRCISNGAGLHHSDFTGPSNWRRP